MMWWKVRWDQWDGRFWVEHLSDPMTRTAAGQFYKTLHTGPLSTRNVALLEVPGRHAASGRHTPPD